MKRIILACVLVLLLGCTKRAAISYSEDEFVIVHHNYDNENNVCGYITEVSETHALIVGENVKDEKNIDLNAYGVIIEHEKLLSNSVVEIGMKVRCVYEEPAHATYPKICEFEIIEIIEEEAKGAVHSELEVVGKVIEVLKKLEGEKEHYLYCINDISYEKEQWKVKVIIEIIETQLIESVVLYVEDSKLEVTEIIYYSREE